MRLALLVACLLVSATASAQDKQPSGGDAVVVKQDVGTNLHVVCDAGCAAGLPGQQTMAASSPVVIASNQSAVPVSGTFFQATQPVSLASVPTHGVTGTFWQATQPVSGTFWQATQPISGTVTANAGTGTFVVGDGAGALNVICDSGCAAGAPGQQTMAASSPVVVASNQSAIPVTLATAPTTPVTGTFWQATQPTSAVDLDIRNLSYLADSVAAVASTSVTGGVAGTLSVGGTTANNAAIAQNPVLTAGEAIAQGTQPAAATTGNQRRILTTVEGAQFVQEGSSNRFSCQVNAVTVMTQCQAAPGAGLRAYVTGMMLSNQAATAVTIDVVYGTGANCATTPIAMTHKVQFGTLNTTTNGQFSSESFTTPLVPAAANAICLRPSAATAFGGTLTGFIAP